MIKNCFQLKYDKTYPNDKEEKLRMDIFIQNEKKIAENNEKFAKGLISYKMAMNRYSDLTTEEFNAQMNLHKIH